MRPCVLRGALRIPVEHVDVRSLKRQLTYSYHPMGAELPEEVKGYEVDGDYLCVPRQFGLKLCNQLQLEIVDETSLGHPASFGGDVKAKAYQEPLLEQILDTFEDSYDVLFRAHTGWGKTIGSLLVARMLGRNLLIIVDQDNLREQWHDVLVEHFGFASKDIGIIQGDKCTYQGKAVTIAMVQTLVKRNFKQDFYDNFGMLIGDEVHTLGAPTFSRVLLRFSARYRLFVSATPRRRDGLQKALDYNCGPVSVAADKKHKESAVYILRNPTVYSFYGNISPKVGRIISEVAEDAQRNLMLADAIIWLWEAGHDVLVMGDRIEHLQALRDMLYYYGVPEEETGLYTGYEVRWVFAKDPSPSKRPQHLHRWKNEEGRMVFAPYSAVALQPKQKTIPKRTLLHTKENASIIFATFGKFTKGVDEPRLSAGLDVTPRSQAEQVHGRILREKEDKLNSLWVTVVDDNNYRLVNSFVGRIGEYLNSNAQLYEWDGAGGVEPCDAKQLQRESRQRVTELKKLSIQETRPGSGVYALAKSSVKKKTEQDKIKERIRASTRRRKPESASGAANARSARRSWQRPG